MKRMFYIVSIITVILTVIGFDHSIAKKRFLTFATSSPGGVYYPLGGGMAVIIEKKTDFRCAAESTGASVENCRLIGSGESDLGMAMGSVAVKAVHGQEPFEKKYSLVTLFQMYPAPEHFITLSGKGIKSIKDLKGKKVGTELPGSGSSVMTKDILEAYGFEIGKDLSLNYFSTAEGVQAMKDGVIDALFQNYAYPASAVIDLAASRDIVLVPMEPSMIDKVLKKNPAYVRVIIPAKTYSKVDYEVPCIGDSNLIIANRQMEDEVAYKIVKAIFENVDKGEWALVNIHPIAKQMTPQNAVISPLELHPGAIKYFKEVGAIK